MQSFTHSFRIAAISGVAAVAMMPGIVWADEGNQASQSGEPTQNASSDRPVNSEIVVTGTLLRGAPPVGSNSINVGEERLQSQGATTSNELLATVPQVSNLFNNVPNTLLAIAANRVQVARPSLRNLSNQTSSAASTLVLFDGHRLAPVGITQNAVDPDLIPAAAIERVEIVTDGGSATYGSDAVGGVINFITRKRFDGLQVSAKYGFADDYQQYEASGIVGKDWGSGSVFAAYTYQHNDAIYGRDRDYIRQVDWLSPNRTPIGRSCTPGNVQIGSTMFALPALAAGANACDASDDNVFVPSSTRHGAIGGLHQELADWLTVDVRAFYGERKSEQLTTARGNVTVTGGSSATNPRQFYYRPVPGQSATANQTVFFSFAPLLGANTLSSTTAFQEWGANAEFQANVTDNWQLRTLFNYSRSNSVYHLQGLSNTLLSAAGRGTTAATAVNFYNPSATDLPLIQQIINTEEAGQGKDELFNARAILDGTLFNLPGGGVKLAVGYEFMHDKFQQRIAQADSLIGTLRNLPYLPYSRDIHSLFGEVQVPIIGEDNGLGFIHSLTLAGSIRYDHYSDFGSTTNPKVGVTLKPVSWLGLRGNYSTSFNAPAPVDQLGALRNTALFVPFNAPFVRPGETPTATGLVAVTGSNPGLVPQTAKIWSVGFDADPPFVNGLHVSASYYNVKFKNIIGTPTSNPAIYTNFPNNITSAPTGLTLTQIRNFLTASGAPNAATVLNNQIVPRCNAATGICNAYALVDFRQGNYGTLNVEGIDFSANYRMTTGFGGIDAGVSGNYQLHRTSQTGAGAPIVDQLKPNVGGGTPRLLLQAMVGADVGSFRAQATLNHSSGYGLVRCDPTTVPACVASTTGVPTGSGRPQNSVGSFDTVNLFFKYDVPGDSLLLKDLSFTININNVFDTNPPLFEQIGDNGYANGFTLGRLVQFGVTKKF